MKVKALQKIDKMLEGNWDETTTMTDWAEYIYSEMNHRGLKTT